MNLFKKRKVADGLIRWISDTMIEVPSVSFFGNASKSPNGVYILAWCDADVSSGVGGFRTKGLGRYVLVDSNEVLADGKMERPNDGKVANNGNFVLHDWGFGEGLKGDFCAFDKDGQLILKHSFQANLYNNGLSADGSLAICQMCNSPHSDGATIAMFDLKSAKLLWQRIPEVRDADSYRFDAVSSIVYLHHPIHGELGFSFDGVFLDEDKLVNSIMKHGRCFEVLDLGLARLSELRVEGNACRDDLETALHILRSAAARCDFEKDRARAHRGQGEIHELLGDIESAIASYEAALEMDSKAGVKRRLDILRKTAKGTNTE
jgi:tetratricopeptide (TPR) repeat protein